jgi:hypothetical protein
MKLPVKIDHVWIYDPKTKKHYDAETPNGVSKPMDLQFFTRKIVKNPPSKGFSIRIGAGAFAQAWKNNNNEVELIINTENWIDGTMTDFSKEILIEARRVASPAVKKLLPELKRKRVDFSEDEGFDFIYSTKKYYLDYDAFSMNYSYEFDKIHESCCDAKGYDSPFKYKKSDTLGIKEFLDRILHESTNETRDNILSVFCIIKSIADSYVKRRIISRWNFDIRSFNIAIDEYGCLIFLDPLVAIGRVENLLEMFDK